MGFSPFRCVTDRRNKMIQKSDIPAAESPEPDSQTTAEQQPVRTGIWRVVRPDDARKTSETSQSHSRTRQKRNSGSTDF